MKKIVILSLVLITINNLAKSQCNPAFSFTVNQGLVSFQAQNSVPGLNHYWWFGDGYGYGAQTSHLYTGTGTYQVIHYVRDSLNNCDDSLVQTIAVSVPADCQASFTTTPDASIRNRRHFTSTSVAGSGNIQSWNWTANGVSLGNGNTLSYTFSPGVYTICLRTVSSTGCASDFCQAIVINDTLLCDLVTGFTASPSGSNSQLMNFIPAPLISSYAYHWDFGDGYASAQPLTNHFYYSGGVYSVTLKVTDSSRGCVDTAMQAINVAGNPLYSCTANFAYTVSSAGLVSLTPLSNQPVTEVYWQVFVSPDSVFFSGLNPSWQAPGTGTFPACVHITTSLGCGSSYCGIIQVDSINTGRMSNHISSYPNPVVNGTVKWYITLDEPMQIIYRIFNANGITMYQSKVLGVTGTNTLVAPVQQLGSGQYFVDIQYGGNRKQSTFIKP